MIKPGATATEPELIRHLRKKIAAYKLPRSIDFVPELPKTSTGRVQKFSLREAEWAGHTRRVQG